MSLRGGLHETSESLQKSTGLLLGTSDDTFQGLKKTLFRALISRVNLGMFLRNESLFGWGFLDWWLLTREVLDNRSKSCQQSSLLVFLPHSLSGLRASHLFHPLHGSKGSSHADSHGAWPPALQIACGGVCHTSI